MTITRLTCVFLVLLRLAIGWHFLFEGLEKVDSPAWSSAPYLREATGPVAPLFRWMAGDALVDRLTPQPQPADRDPAQTPPHLRLPKAIDRDWNDYAARFADYYQLDDAQRQLMDAKLEQQKDKTALWLLSGKKTVKRESPYGPSVDAERTTPERLQEYQDKMREANELQDQEASLFGPDLGSKLRTAKSDVNRLRNELRRDLEAQTKEMKQALRDVLTPQQAKAALPDILTPEQLDLPDVKKAIAEAKEPKTLNEQIAKVLAPEQVDYDPVPGPAKWPWPDIKKFDRPNLSWSRLEWIDWLTKYGLCVIGVCLLAGLLTRSACVSGALFLLMVYLTMPPWPGLPENPRAEGHYFIVNKNLIEMLALMALATTRSGRWLGLDALLQFLNPRRWRRRAAVRSTTVGTHAKPVGV